MRKVLNALAATIVSFCSLGMGHLYVGAYRKALILIPLTVINYILVLFFSPLVYAVKPSYFIYAYWGAIVYSAIYLIWVVSDALILGFQDRAYEKKKFLPTHKGLRFFVLSLIGIALSVVLPLVLPSKSVYSYIIPSHAMSPTLEKGDYIVAIENSGALLTEMRDMLVTYNVPPDEADALEDYKIHVGRIAAVEGDKIQIEPQTGNFKVNGRYYPVVRRGSATFEELKQRHSSPTQDPFTARLWKGEELEVPLGQLFILRDNYSDSADSRTNGPIDASRIGEKVVFISFSKSDQEIRWDRMNKEVK